MELEKIDHSRTYSRHQLSEFKTGIDLNEDYWNYGKS